MILCVCCDSTNHVTNFAVVNVQVANGLRILVLRKPHLVSVKPARRAVWRSVTPKHVLSHNENIRINVCDHKFTLQYTNIAIEHGPFVDGLPIKSGGFP